MRPFIVGQVTRISQFAAVVTFRGSSPSTSVVPLSNQVTTLNNKRFKGLKMFSDGHLDGQAVSGCGFHPRLDPAPMLGDRHAELALAEQDTARALPPRPHLAGGGFRKPGKLTPFEKRQDYVAIIPDDGDRALVAGFLPQLPLLDFECVELPTHDNVLLHAAFFAGNTDVTLPALRSTRSAPSRMIFAISSSIGFCCPRNPSLVLPSRGVCV